MPPSIVETSIGGVGLSFNESARGHWMPGELSPERGEAVGERKKSSIAMDLKVAIGSIDAFDADPKHRGQVTGTVTIPALGGELKVRSGTYSVFPDEGNPDERKLTYDMVAERKN